MIENIEEKIKTINTELLISLSETCRHCNYCLIENECGHNKYAYGENEINKTKEESDTLVRKDLIKKLLAKGYYTEDELEKILFDVLI